MAGWVGLVGWLIAETLPVLSWRVWDLHVSSTSVIEWVLSVNVRSSPAGTLLTRPLLVLVTLLNGCRRCWWIFVWHGWTLSAWSHAHYTLCLSDNQLRKLGLKSTALPQSYGVSLVIWDHSFTCHQTQVNINGLNLSQGLVLYLPAPDGWKAELT